MKKLIQFVLFVIVFFGIANAQSSQWNFRHWFPEKGRPFDLKDTLMRANNHGIAVDPDGKVWATDYYAISKDSIIVSNYFPSGKDTSHVDSVKKYMATGKVTLRAIYCFNPNGTQTSFSPIKYLTIGGTIDTLGANSILIKGIPVIHSSLSMRTNRGLATDHQGNILASVGAFIYRINYKTGAGMARLDTDPLAEFKAKASITASASDQNGNIFVHRVVNANQPIKMYDASFNFIGNVVDTATKANGFSRSIAVSKNGNDVYYSSYEHSYALRYHSDNGVLGPYVFKDTLFKGLSIETFTWDKKTGYLWASSGSYLSLPNRHWTKTYWSYATWYAFDMTTPATPVLKDSVKWYFWKLNSANERPRGFAFSFTSDTIYAGAFGDGAVPGIEVFTRGPASVKPIYGVIVTDFKLEQNYPNPFNPTTQIRFEIRNEGVVSLKVHDLLGKEITTLVNQKMSKGAYTITFDGSNLTSGTYIYTLTSNGQRLSNKMILMK